MGANFHSAFDQLQVTYHQGAQEVGCLQKTHTKKITPKAIPVKHLT